jgi:hypothetical protein
MKTKPKSVSKAKHSAEAKSIPYRFAKRKEVQRATEKAIEKYHTALTNLEKR